ncbi:hypothetical protein PR202_ga14424 [Eleusine coracana subsp. coracana]|uniref:F-box domain-containing protein n=1 Tax=Eleusine coracana subsp. coracana TaxID=191504 RepID=A0AAV5CGK6_ELECO|nr:hypothetical protein PR202_ga14424 [Eleusine coracana subsp. coracana]
MTTMSKLQVARESSRPGWADLPCDLLESVLGRLPVPDRLRVPAVCTAWQSATRAPLLQNYQPAPPPSPWLMLPFNPTAHRQHRQRTTSDDDSNSKLSARFLSLTEGSGGRTYAIRQPLPAVSDRLCIGSSPDGWLVTADNVSELHLLNPVTGAQVPLPSVTTLPYVDATSDGRVVSYSLRFSCCFTEEEDDDEVMIPPETFAAEELRYEIYDKAVVLSPPRGSSLDLDGYAVLLICQPLSRLAVARDGDTAWTLLDTPGRCWADAVCASSEPRVVYTMDTAGRVDAWDMTAAPPSSRTIAPPCFCCCTGMSASCRNKYLVELSSPPGRLLQVHRIREAAHARYKWWEPRPDRVQYTTTKVELFEWTGGQRWAQLDSSNNRTDGVLAGRALFLGKSASLCVPADGLPTMIHGNCVYFTDDGPWSRDRCREVAPDVGVLDLADGTYRPPRAAVRDLLWKWPPPVWVFPSLAPS